MEDVLEARHESIHAEYRQKLAQRDWDLAVANATIKEQAQLIEQMKALLPAAE